ncbi:uncharacterized protein BDZ83DRAFT_733765 [Colletotrichum acutatum]|uniref:Uncharacterized protein n=1 Tax=Glomerella acutata TaxID=27357 RepID=A0AAD8UDF2_GLOAC|nr:uncharacterized protein BDZ83DRAFT_733765 [Colletotrichum acutatum]KAK1717490.1 hypothetical protein BDZ83DRAFT_733765 [Colletotrichum acutatum]
MARVQFEMRRLWLDAAVSGGGLPPWCLCLGVILGAHTGADSIGPDSRGWRWLVMLDSGGGRGGRGHDPWMTIRPLDSRNSGDWDWDWDWSTKVPKNPSLLKPRLCLFPAVVRAST